MKSSSIAVLLVSLASLLLLGGCAQRGGPYPPSGSLSDEALDSREMGIYMIVNRA